MIIMKTFNAVKTKNGFTLVELLVSLSILIIASTAFLPVFIYVAKTNEHNKIESTSNTIATSIMEQIRGMKYENIGTVSGNPSGVIPQTQTITRNNIKYYVETLISWSSVTKKIKENNNETNSTAFKNIRIIVSAKGVFTEKNYNSEKVFSISSKDGESEVSTLGNLRVGMKKSDGSAVSDVSVPVCIKSDTLSQNMITDFNGQAFFANMPLGIYSVMVDIPEGYDAPQGETYHSDRKLIRTNISSVEYMITDVYFYMDRMEDFNFVTLKFIDQETNQVIKPTCNITLDWNIDGESKNEIVKKSAEISGYNSEILPKSFIGRLFNKGSYELNIKRIRTIENKYAVHGIYKNDGTLWDGSFSDKGQTTDLIVKVKKVINKVLYFEDTLDSFVNPTVYNTAANIKAIDFSNGCLALNSTIAEIPLKNAKGGTNPGRAIDNDKNTYCSIKNRSMTFELNNDLALVPCELRIRLSSILNRIPSSIMLYGVKEDDSLVELCSESNFQVDNNIVISTTEKFSKFKLNIVSSGDTSSWIYDLEIICNWYSANGTRFLKIPIGNLDLSDKTKAPYFFIESKSVLSKDTSINLYAALANNNSNTIPVGFVPIEADDTINNTLLPPGTSITNGTHLWIKQEFATLNISETPLLDSMTIEYYEVTP